MNAYTRPVTQAEAFHGFEQRDHLTEDVKEFSDKAYELRELAQSVSEELALSGSTFDTRITFRTEAEGCEVVSIVNKTGRYVIRTNEGKELVEMQTMEEREDGSYYLDFAYSQNDKIYASSGPGSNVVAIHNNPELTSEISARVIEKISSVLQKLSEQAKADVQAEQPA